MKDKGDVSRDPFDSLKGSLERQRSLRQNCKSRREVLERARERTVLSVFHRSHHRIISRAPETRMKATDEEGGGEKRLHSIQFRILTSKHHFLCRPLISTYEAERDCLFTSFSLFSCFFVPSFTTSD